MSNSGAEVSEKDEKKVYGITEATTNQTSQNDQSGSDEEFDEKNPFSDPEVAAHWKQTYANSRYECRHVFDPTVTWTEEEEKRLIRKLDWRVCLWAVLSFLPAKALGLC